MKERAMQAIGDCIKLIAELGIEGGVAEHTRRSVLADLKAGVPSARIQQLAGEPLAFYANVQLDNAPMASSLLAIIRNSAEQAIREWEADRE